MPLDDRDLTDAPLMGILGACRGVLEEIRRGEIYGNHSTRISDRAAVTSFFTAIARLAPDEQQKCFDVIVSFLKEEGEGQEHILNRLLNGKRNYRKSSIKPPLAI